MAHVIAHLVIQFDGTIWRVDEHIMADNAETDLIGGVFAQVQRVVAVVDCTMPGDHVIARSIDNGIIAAGRIDHVIASAGNKCFALRRARQNIIPRAAEALRRSGSLPIGQRRVFQCDDIAIAKVDFNIGPNLSHSVTGCCIRRINRVAIIDQVIVTRIENRNGCRA